MPELNLTPMGDNGSYFYSITINGSTYTDAALYYELTEMGKVWVEISYDETKWYVLKGTTTFETINDLIPLKNFNKSLVYRFCSSEKVITFKLIHS